jgi:hypothetical protein
VEQACDTGARAGVGVRGFKFDLSHGQAGDPARLTLVVWLIRTGGLRHCDSA